MDIKKVTLNSVKGKVDTIENAIEKLKEYGLGTYAVKKWYEIKEYKMLLGFFTAMESVSILKYDRDGERIFHEAAVLCINETYNN